MDRKAYEKGAALRRKVNGEWPATLEPLSDTYADQTFQGPLG